MINWRRRRRSVATAPEPEFVVKVKMTHSAYSGKGYVVEVSTLEDPDFVLIKETFSQPSDEASATRSALRSAKARLIRKQYEEQLPKVYNT